MPTKLSILFVSCFFLISSAGGSGNITVHSTSPFPTADNAETPSLLFKEELNCVLSEKKPGSFVLGKTQLGRNIKAYFFPGTSEKRALVIGGMHGSELSSIEVASELVRKLQQRSNAYYNVIIIPSLFPDNAETAKQFPLQIGDAGNIGRYSFAGAVDPNRQMPTPGRAFDEEHELDHAGRKIENENSLLLGLIGEYRPQRIVNLHAIRDKSCAGVFADPRTDHNSIALGYATDSSLAIEIGKNIEHHGGYVPGNSLSTVPNALYYKDPEPVAAGQFQKRNFTGSFLPGKRGGGVSLGTWASTAVFDEFDSTKNRDAMRILTIEFPGSKRPIDYQLKKEQNYYQKLVEAYASGIYEVFLQEYFVEG
jgi:hypothetical protein